KVSVCVVLLLILSSMAEGVQEEGDGKEAKFFIKSYSTTTWTFLSSFTSTVPYTCYLSGGGLEGVIGACAGRRLRHSKKLSSNHEATVTDLLSSTEEGSLDVLDGLSNQEENYSSHCGRPPVAPSPSPPSPPTTPSPSPPPLCVFILD
ncbi:hypothetical protein Hamer_G022065, partial [Homarus americanus]